MTFLNPNYSRTSKSTSSHNIQQQPLFSVVGAGRQREEEKKEGEEKRIGWWD